MNRIWSRHLGLAAVLFGLTGASVYFVMINVTLAHIKALSGHVPFDMRPLGYDIPEARALLDGLGAQGRSYYLRYQVPLDTFYPALLAWTLISAMRWFGQKLPASRLVRTGIVLSVGAALCDYGENLGVVAMILNWPDLSAPLVYTSSSVTIAKSVLTTSAVVVAILTGGIWARQATVIKK